MEEISYRTNAQYTGGSLYCVFVFSQVIFRAYVTRIQLHDPHARVVAQHHSATAGFEQGRCHGNSPGNQVTWCRV